MGIFSGFHRLALSSTVTGSNWNLGMLVFVEGGKPENPEKNPRSKDENQQQTQPTYDVESGNRTRATLVGGECSHHCAIPAPPTTVVVMVYSPRYPHRVLWLPSTVPQGYWRALVFTLLMTASSRLPTTANGICSYEKHQNQTRSNILIALLWVWALK